MKKYYLGFLIIGLIVLGLTGFVLSKGIASKADKKTFESAQEIAKDLNAYIVKEKKIPTSLQDAKITDAPSSIRYEKKTSTTYEFCVTYKANKSYGSADVSSVLYGAALGGAIDDSSNYDDYESDYVPSSLYIDYYYQKGENCQTVKPIIRTNSSPSRSPSLYDNYCTGSYLSSYDEECASYNEL